MTPVVATLVDGDALAVRRQALVILGASTGNRPLGVISKVNGQDVRNLRQLAEPLRDNQDEFLRIETADRNESLVFRTSEIKAATEQILVVEGIRYQASEALRDVWRPQ